MKKSIIMLAVMLLSTLPVRSLTWYDGVSPVRYHVNGKVSPVVKIALEMFSDDMRQVTGQPAVESKSGAVIEIYELGKVSESKLRGMSLPVGDLSSKPDGFIVCVKDGRIAVVGSNGRGTAYGILELSREAGVSPWVWWGDSRPERKSRLTLADDYFTMQSPSVEYRGIFLNDEDWSSRVWSQYTYDKSETFGEIGPKTYKRIYQLMLRLRANTIWPGMHTGTVAFFKVAGNKEMADSCGIVVGTSHCEPLLRNNLDEWDEKTRGRYNYITNRDEVQDYWTERLREVKGGEYIYTIGMRGIHDGSMEGVSTMQEKTEALQQVIDDQRVLLGKYVNKSVNTIPQTFVPYKEVLEIMENGLVVPDDVTLMWCDDNYGYMTRLSDAEQQKRSGGGGVYYHLSYWGRPHDYLWLTTTQPGLVCNEMHEAYDKNARRIWIVNVHDPKVACYDLELFLDMAWNINSVDGSNVDRHLERWLCREFGETAGKRLLPVMEEWYRLTGMRKPEFMGWTQVELNKKLYPRGRSQVVDTEFSHEFGDEMYRYLGDYARLSKEVDEIESMVPSDRADEYFAAVKYPVQASHAMAEKLLEAQMARSYYMGGIGPENETREAKMKRHAARSIAAYQRIQSLTDYYNNKLSGGKWKGIMDSAPRDLYVFFPPTLPGIVSDNEVSVLLQETEERNTQIDTDGAIVGNACGYTSSEGKVSVVKMLGHSMKAVSVEKGGSISFDFNADKEGDAVLKVALIPTQPNDKGDLRFSVSVDGGEAQEFSLKEPFRSERWKQNVLRGQAVRDVKVHLTQGTHRLTLKAIDDHIIFDQWMIDYDANRNFYVFPIESALK